MTGRFFPWNKLHLTLLCAFVVVLMSSCGFKLRGQIALSEPLQAIALQGTAEHAELAISIRNVLNRAGGKLVELSAANSVLVITEDSNTRRVLSVDNLGQANAYTLIYRLGFRLDTPSATSLVKPQRIEQQRQYRFDANSVLAKGDEEQRIIRVMREAAVTRMLVMLQAQLENQSAVNPTNNASSGESVPDEPARKNP